MATAGSIVVNLIARTEAFTKGISRSRRNLDKLKKQTVKTMQTIKMFGAIAATAAVGGLAALTKSSMKSIDAIAKMSDELQIATDTLAGLEYATGITGTTMSSLHKGLQIMVRRLGEANEGYGEGKKGLDAMGVSAMEMINMGTEDAFFRIADAVKDARTAAEKANIAYQMFGRGGVDMLNLLNMGGTGLRDMVRDAERLGITFDRDMAARVEQANDAILRMKQSVSGVGNVLAISLAPLIESIADNIANTVSGNNSLEAMQRRVRGVAIAATYIADTFLVIKAIIQGIIGLGQKLVQGIVQGFVIILDLASELANALKLEGLASTIKSLANELDDFQSDFGESAAKQFDKSLASFMKVGAARKEIEKIFEDAKKKQETISKGIPQIVAPEEELKKKPFDFRPTAREIDTSLVSVAGLAMGARTVTLNDVDRTLQEIERNTRKTANQEILN